MSEIIKNEFKNFEEIKHIDENGVEFWYARELQKLFNYVQWRNFENAINKAMISIKETGNIIENHFFEVFADTSKNPLGGRPTNDFKLTRQACYLIAQNGDPKIKEIANAQKYFAIQTRRQEKSDEYKKEIERINARAKLTETEIKLSTQIYNKTDKDEKAFGYIRSQGDKTLFGGNTTRQMKEKLGIPQSRAVADFLPTVSIKAKDLASEMTNHQLETDKDLEGKIKISLKHNSNNKQVREALNRSGIYPENLPPAEDIKKVKTKIKKQDKIEK